MRSSHSPLERITVNMNKFAIILLSCLAVALAEENAVLKDLEKHAKEFQTTFSDNIKKLTESKETQQLQKALKDGSDTVVQQLSKFVSSLQAAAADADGKTREAITRGQAEVQRTVDQLKREHPEVQRNAEQLRDQITRAVQAAAQETQKVAKEVSANIEQSNKQLAPKLKAAYDDFVKHAEQVQKSLHETANKQ